MRFLTVAFFAVSLLTVTACTNGGIGNSSSGEGSPAAVTPTPAPTATAALPPLGGIGQLAFRPGSYIRANVKSPKQAISGGVIIVPALYGNYATRGYKGHTLLFAGNDEFLVASELLPIVSTHHVGPGDSLVLFRVPKAGLCWYVRTQQPVQYTITPPASTQTGGPMTIESIDGSLVIVTKLPLCGATR